jgi:hypothetical protein
MLYKPLSTIACLGAIKMSYLVGPRMHFAGNFTAEVSTVNNFVTHFKDPNKPPQPGWNPSGTGSWAITGCKIKSVIFKDGTVARTSADDGVIGAPIVQLGRARLVDLDPEQQMVSQIWGLRLRLTSTAGAPAMTGDFKVAPFTDIWPNRLAGGGGDFAMSAYYQSLITGIAWGDLFGSRFLSELQQGSDPSSLSIKFNVDGFDQTRHVGRIVGTIGPTLASEPAHFVFGRQCMGHFQGPVWYFCAAVDSHRRKLIADFGNALQTTSFSGPFDPTLNLSIGVLAGNQFTSLGRIPIGPTGWYEQTAGVCEFPVDRPLTDAEMAQLSATPIVVVQQTAAGTTVVASEGTDGLHVRADEFVYRMSANDVASVTLRASRFGQPLPNANIAISLDPSQLQQGAGDPAVDKPEDAVKFPTTIVADAQGIASLPITAGSIDKPRTYIDGQVYGVRYTLPQSNPNAGGYFNLSDFVSILVWTTYSAPANPDWNNDVGQILTQYQKLYPVMKGFVDLGVYASVVANKTQMRDVFSHPETDPRYMPVTRDLSPAKRNMILAWLNTTGNAGQPNLGPPAVVVAAAPEILGEALQPAAVSHEAGGKSAALRNLVGSARSLGGFQKRLL